MNRHSPVHSKTHGILHGVWKPAPPLPLAPPLPTAKRGLPNSLSRGILALVAERGSVKEKQEGSDERRRALFSGSNGDGAARKGIWAWRTPGIWFCRTASQGHPRADKQAVFRV